MYFSSVPQHDQLQIATFRLLFLLVRTFIRTTRWSNLRHHTDEILNFLYLSSATVNECRIRVSGVIGNRFLISFVE